MLCIARNVLSRGVRLSVRPSVTRRHSIEKAKHIIKVSSPTASHAQRVLSHGYDLGFFCRVFTAYRTERRERTEHTELVILMGHLFKTQPNPPKIKKTLTPHIRWTQPMTNSANTLPCGTPEIHLAGVTPTQVSIMVDCLAPT